MHWLVIKMKVKSVFILFFFSRSEREGKIKDIFALCIVSEPYLQFKETMLTQFIAPLLDAEHSCEEAKSYGLEALSHFSVNDISTLLPEKANDYLSAILESNMPNKSYEHVLVKLMSNELDHMRRGLFKEEKTTNKQAEVVQKKDNNSIGDREREIGNMFMEKWSEGHVAPGLRAGYAIGILYISNFSTEPVPGHSLEAISKTKWYRTMVTSFTDVTLTDHLLVRISSISSWQAFFHAVFKGKEVEVESITAILLKDLLSRLERSTVPGVSSNILLAMTGNVYPSVLCNNHLHLFYALRPCQYPAFNYTIICSLMRK